MSMNVYLFIETETNVTMIPNESKFLFVAFVCDTMDK